MQKNDSDTAEHAGWKEIRFNGIMCNETWVAKPLMMLRWCASMRCEINATLIVARWTRKKRNVMKKERKRSGE
jgi:hypothetical protein